MKTLRNILILAMSVTVMASCGGKKGGEELEPTTSTNSQYTTTAAVTVSIEGMVCAMGCAKTIQDEIAGLEGVTFSSVDYEAGQGTFKFDESVTSADKIVEAIGHVNDGAYKTTVIAIDKEASTEPKTEGQGEKLPA